MGATPETLRTHIDYTKWASGKLVEAAKQLSVEELNRDFHTADKSVLGTLVHVYAADRIWMRRIKGEPCSVYMDPAVDMRLEVLENDWPVLLERWTKLVADLDEKTLHERVQFRDLSGNPQETPMWQIVLHVVNHATHHRGQAAGFIRAMGKQPPKLDLILYYRELKA